MGAAGYLLVSFLASAVGSICGIGGGVIIKPAFDALGGYSVSTVSFLSGCIVLSMSAYCVLSEQLIGKSLTGPRAVTPLEAGAAAGGVIGKILFDALSAYFPNPQRIGAVQAGALFLLTLFTLVYTLKKSTIRTRSLRSQGSCLLLGLALGLMSAFLGIGGGPINLVVLSYFFSMDAKEAAQNSLHVIFLSQLASLLYTLLSHNIPPFPPLLLAATVVCGGMGGAAGRGVNRKLPAKAVDNLFICLTAIIMVLCCYNFYQYIYSI